MNSPELLATSLGQGGSKYVAAGGQASGRWKLMYVITQAVLNEYDDNNMTGDITGVTLAQGTLIGGDIRIVKVTSGSVLLYE